MNDKPALRPQIPVGEALRAVAHDVIAEGTAAVGEEAAVTAVHDFRKAMKRWRALLRLLEPLLPEEDKALRVQARDLARDLAHARDARAALDGLEDTSQENSLSERTLKTVRARLEEMRQRAERNTLTEAKREQLRTALATATARIEQWPLAAVAFSDVAARLAQGYRRARERVPEDWTTADPEALHELRQRVVEHRYQMELVVPLWPRVGRLWVDEAQRLRDRLGTCQDLTVLARLTKPHQPLAPWRSRLTPLIAARRENHVEHARRLARRLFAERPKAFKARLEAMWGDV
jgi:CHAD domain-containing protein